MTREEFVALVERLRPVADARPAAYRWRVRAFAWLGYGFILLLLLGSLAIAGPLVLLSRVAGGLAIKVGWLLVVFAWRILKSLWVKFERPAGRELTRAEAPVLYAAVDGITRRLDAPRFHHILLTDEFNAAVTQQPRLGVLGWPRNFLLVGLPLLQSLSPEQAEAVVAHELGHLRGGHGRFGAWIYRVNQTWEQLMMQLGGDSSWVAKFFRWYAPRFTAWSYGIRRPEEFEADTAAARAVSGRALADALCALRVRGAALSELHCEPLLSDVKTTVAPPVDAYSRLLPIAKSGRLPAAREAEILAESLKAETDAFDSHPSLADRLAALNQPARVPELPATTAAEAFLGPLLPTLTAELDAAWLADNQQPWTERHAELTRQRERLADLADRHARHRALTPDERWELADLTEDHESAEASLPLFRALFTEPEKELAAKYAVGRILLHQNDPAGLSLLDEVMDREPNARANGLALQRAYHERQGDRAAARRLETDEIRHADLADLAAEERSVLPKLDTYFPAELPADSPLLRPLRAGLAERPAVRVAWLLQKRVVHFPEKPLYVLVLELTPEARKQIEKAEGRCSLVQELAQSLEMPGEAFIVPATNDNAWLATIARRHPEAQCYVAT